MNVSIHDPLRNLTLLTGPNRHQLQKYEQRREYLGIVQRNLREQFLVHQQLECERHRQERPRPTYPQEREFQRRLQLHANEDDDAEVSVQGVARKQREEYHPPVVVVDFDRRVVLECKEYGEDQHGD